MKNLLKFTLGLVLAFAVGIKAYQAWTSNEVSDVVLANVAALAADENNNGDGEAIIVCSAKCNDGIGKCWRKTSLGYCEFDGFQNTSCTGLCKTSTGFYE